MTESQERIESPCVRNCCLDLNDVCLGCFRSLSEILEWGQANNEKRQEILLNSKQRAENSDQNFSQHHFLATQD